MKTRNRPRVERRKGQAALEYVITYGWGFVVILVVIGALAYFGYLNPSRYVPSRCSLGVQLECVDYRLVEADPDVPHNGNITLILRNNFGAPIKVLNITTFHGRSYCRNCPLTIKNGFTNTSYIRLDTTDEIMLLKGERMTVPLNVTFSRDSANTPEHVLAGEIFATVQKK